MISELPRQGRDDYAGAYPRPRPSFVPLLTLAFAALLALWLTAAPAGAAVRTTATEHGKAERMKTLPISQGAWQQTRSVMNLGPGRIGDLRSGDRLRVGGDFEITTCLKPNPNHPGNGQPCVGNMYGFSPKIRAKIVLAPGPDVTAASRTKTISRTIALKCNQKPPNRNHHCVVSVPWSTVSIGAEGSLPCQPNACHVNMLATAYDSSAGSGHKVVLGSSDDNKRITQKKAKLNAVRYRPGTTRANKRWRGGRATKKVPVGPEDSKIKRKVIYSAKVQRLRAGDQLVVDAKALTKIGRLPYNVFQRTEVVFAKKRNSTKPAGKVLDTTARVSASNGLNCTQGKSAHSNVCSLRKTGILSVKKNVRGPFFVNLVVGQHAIGIRSGKWRSGDKSKVIRRGFVKVEKLKGKSVCNTCSTGWTRFAPNIPTGGDPGKLVEQLRPFGITQGSYNCINRTSPKQLNCKWRSAGRFGAAPAYACDRKAILYPGRDRFVLKVCKEAMVADLWNRLLQRSPSIKPRFVGGCKEWNGNDYRCSWQGDGQGGTIKGRYCTGKGIYRLPEHRWTVNADCRGS